MECLIIRPEDVDRESSTLILRDDEAHHALRSLRLKPGDELLATDLVGTCYKCRIHTPPPTLVGGGWGVVPCEIEEILPEYGEPSRDILLIQALISQPARWEFLLEKTTELGVLAIQPVTTERTERVDFKRDRSERILRAAVKQTKRARMPELREVSEFREALSDAVREGHKIIVLHEGAERSAGLVTDDKIAIAIGPEGGFSDEEIQMTQAEFDISIVSLGPRRLRAETAALAALAIVVEC